VARFRLLHHRPSLDRAIGHLERSAAGLPVGHPDRPLNLATLSNCLLWRYELTSDPADLDGAVNRLREAVAAPGLPPRERAAHHGDLAAVLRARFVLYGERPDLDEAIAAATDAVEHADDPASAITNRALARLARYELTAGLDDLLGALHDARTPVRGPIAAALHRGMRLGVLVDALGSRYQYTDDPEDLDAAISAGREALATLSRVDPNRAAYAAELSLVLRLTDDPARHTEAVEAAEEALRDSPPEHVDRAYRQSTLSMALLARHLSTGDRDDLRRAREMAGEALAAGTELNRPMLLQRAGLMAARWFDVTADPAAPAEGERAIRAALAATPADHPMRDALAVQLADLLTRNPNATTRPAANASPADEARPADGARQAEAREILLAAVRRPGPALSMHSALRAARRLSELCAETGDAENALLGYRRAIELLPTAAWPGLRRAVRESRLADAPRATDAVAQALSAGHPDEAVELLEAGRSVLWSQQLNLRTDLTRLRAAAPDLEGRMNAIRGWFERPSVAGREATSGFPSSPARRGAGRTTPESPTAR
jgi:tetratricopeptide (TPR) repeat protein